MQRFYFSTVSFFGSAEMDSGCNGGCQCSQDVYNPVCGIDGIMYYSPCYAGCQTENIGDEKVELIVCYQFNYNGIRLVGSFSNDIPWHPN